MFIKARNHAKNHKDKGFTLIELLLVIVVISVLAGVMLSVINVNVIRGRARDSQRKADIGKLQAALELYYATNRTYPPSSSWIKVLGGTGDSSDSLTNLLAPAAGARFINEVPSDPLGDATLNPTGPCDFETNYRYNYRTGSSGAIYLLTAIMEATASDDDSKCTSLTNWSRDLCGAAHNTTCGCSGITTTPAETDVCYAVQNP